MKRIAAFGLTALCMTGCASAQNLPPPAADHVSGAVTAADDPVVAQSGDVKITRDQLYRPLVDGYGLNVLLNLLQLEMVKQDASQAGVTVTAQDIRAERDDTIYNMFKDANQKQIDQLNDAIEKKQTAEAEKIRQNIKRDNEQAFDQFLANQHVSRSEFEIVTEINANLRKIAQPMLKGKITEENLKQAFANLYGERVQCRHIQCSTLKQIQEAKRRLAAGEPFAKVAEEMSENRQTAPSGGELDPFSLHNQNLPQNFRDAAFALKVGEVSDIVAADGSYHLIKLEKRIPPTAVKFDDVKDAIRKQLEQLALQQAMKDLRGRLGDQVRKSLVIDDPVLKKQWADRLAKLNGKVKDPDEIRRDQDEARLRSATQPATKP